MLSTAATVTAVAVANVDLRLDPENDAVTIKPPRGGKAFSSTDDGLRVNLMPVGGRSSEMIVSGGELATVNPERRLTRNKHGLGHFHQRIVDHFQS